MRWRESSQGRMAPISRQCVQERNYETETVPEYAWETRSNDEYFLDPVPGLSDSPGTTPGSEGTREPPTPPTPTPAGRGLAMDEYRRKQRNALWTSEEEADFEYVTSRPTARALFINHRQRPSDKQRPSLRADDPALHASKTDGCGKNDADRGTESGLENKGYTQGISNAEIDEEVRKVMERVVAEVQAMNAGAPPDLGTLHLLRLESVKGLYRVCCRKSNGGLSPERECYDNATRFHDILNYMAVKELLLERFRVPPPNPKCGRCSRKHKDWIRIPEEDVGTSIEPRKGPLDEGRPDVHDHACELSKGGDKRSGIDAVAEMQKDKTAVEDMPINIQPSQMPVLVDDQSHSSPEGKTNGSLGRLEGMTGKSTVSTEQQAPGLLDIGIAAVRSLISGLI
ncbi:hypothetical protein BDW66DRAFT_154203 [Aspergillus desertorum]